MSHEASTRTFIVVGVDGSELSRDALRWAATQAQLTDCSLIAVTGFDIPWTIMIAPTYTEADYVRDAHEVLDRGVHDALGSEPRIHVEKRLVPKRAALALAEAAVGAQLLVIGSHGSRQLPGSHLGSVANYCVHHSPCPVLVFRQDVHSG
jgi:nucleotide-binding universal stress UspA family protein